MIERKDILSIPYLKKTTFTGSYDGLRFRFAVVKKESEVQEKEQQVLQITAWEGPYGFDATSEEKKQQNGIDWLNALWEADPEKWKRAKSEW